MNISYRFLIDLTWVQKKNTLNIFVSYSYNDIWTDYVPCNLYRLRMPSKYLHFFISPDGSENFFKFLANKPKTLWIFRILACFMSMLYPYQESCIASHGTVWSSSSFYYYIHIGTTCCNYHVGCCLKAYLQRK